jgi:hypothetical protein
MPSFFFSGVLPTSVVHQPRPSLLRCNIEFGLT